MEIFQTIWTALTTPNELIINIISIPSIFIEMYVLMLLFTSILNISTTKKQKYLYIIIASSWTIFSNLIIPKDYGIFINMFFIPISVMIIFKANFLKGIFALIIPSIITVLLDTIVAKICLTSFGITRDIASTIPLYKLLITLSIYFILYLIYRMIKKLKYSITILDNLDKRNKLILILNSLIGCIAIAIQFYLIGYYNQTLPIFITVFSLITLITYFFISLYSLTKTTQLQITKQNLEEAQLYNKSLKILHDNVRAFKHDFNNIVQAIGRLCWN